MQRSVARASLAGAIFLAAGAVGGAESGFTVTINGVDVTGLVNQKFENCIVEFDGSGNVKITAPGYEIKKIVPDEPSPVPPSTTEGALAKHYYMFTESSNGSEVGDEYALLVNDKIVKKFKSSDSTIVEDITPFLKGGSNLVIVTAQKSSSYDGGSAKSWFRIVFGEGHEEENKAVIKKTLHKFTRTAEDSEPGQSSYTLKAK